MWLGRKATSRIGSRRYFWVVICDTVGVVVIGGLLAITRTSEYIKDQLYLQNNESPATRDAPQSAEHETKMS